MISRRPVSVHPHTAYAMRFYTRGPRAQAARSEQLFQQIMSILESHPEISRQDLADRIGCSSGNLSKVVDHFNLRLFEENYPRHIRVRWEGQKQFWRLAPRYYFTRRGCRVDVETFRIDMLDQIHLGDISNN